MWQRVGRAVGALWRSYQAQRGRRVFVVMVNESIIYERQVWAADEPAALMRACVLLSQQRTRGWLLLGRHLRNVRTRRP